MVFERYAKYYDVLHANKDYDAEVSYLVELFKRFGEPKSILDVGCGTGEHMIRFQNLGYSVAGIDLSGEMIEQAKAKNLLVWKADMRDFGLEAGPFDVALCLFGGIGYLSDIHELMNTLKCVRQHLKLDGLFIFDYWNGIAVLKQKPEVTVRIAELDDLEIFRIARPRLDVEKQICRVNYTCFVKQNDQCVDFFEEEHPLRFYFPAEIAFALNASGFDRLFTWPFGKDKGPITDSWNVITVARNWKKNEL